MRLIAMAKKNLIGRICQKNDSANNWTKQNTILLNGEIGIENDTGLVKIGDGESGWNSLPYINQFGKVNNLSVAKTASDITYLQNTEAQFIIDVT